MQINPSDPSKMNETSQSSSISFQVMETPASSGRSHKGNKIQYIVPALWIFAGFVINALGVYAFTVFELVYIPYYANYWRTELDNVKNVLFPALGYILIGIGILQILSSIFPILTDRTVSQQQTLQSIRDEVEKNPGKAILVWDFARETLQSYFDSNKKHMNSIFIFSVVVMIGGFALISMGIWYTFNDMNSLVQVSLSKGNTNLPPAIFTPAIIGGISGIVTEFIGATFLFMYRSIVSQADNNIKTLERMNTVGMAMTILDTLSNELETTKELRDKTATEIAKMILAENSSREEGRKPKS